MKLFNTTRTFLHPTVRDADTKSFCSKDVRSQAATPTDHKTHKTCSAGEALINQQSSEANLNDLESSESETRTVCSAVSAVYLMNVYEQFL